MDDKWEREFDGPSSGRVRQGEPSLLINYVGGSTSLDPTHGHDDLPGIADVDVPVNKPYDEGVKVCRMVYDVFWNLDSIDDDGDNNGSEYLGTRDPKGGSKSIANDDMKSLTLERVKVAMKPLFLGTKTSILGFFTMFVNTITNHNVQNIIITTFLTQLKNCVLSDGKPCLKLPLLATDSSLHH